WLETSQMNGFAFSPSSSALALAMSALMSSTATLAPLAMKALDIAAPMPEAPPVTMATFPVSGKFRSIWGACSDIFASGVGIVSLTARHIHFDFHQGCRAAKTALLAAFQELVDVLRRHRRPWNIIVL